MHDFLQQVLYYNSISKNSKKQRLIAWLFVILCVVFFNFVFLYFFPDQIEIGYFLGAIPVSIIGILLFPYIHKRILKKQFLSFVKEGYKNNFGKETKLSFYNETLEINNSTGESKINYSSIEKIIEIYSHFFLISKTGAYIIIPKSELIKLDSVRNKLNMLAMKNKIMYSNELDWKWK